MRTCTVLYVGGSHCLLIATHPDSDIETIHFERTITGDLYVTLGAYILIMEYCSSGVNSYLG